MFADVCHCFFVPKTCFRNMDSSRPKSSCTSILTYLGICPWTDCGQFLELHKKEPHSTCTSCTWKKVWYAWWSPRNGLLLLVFAPPWSKVGTFLMEFALPDQPGEQDCWGGITGSEKGHCGKQRSPAAAWHWAQEIAERARAYGTLVQPVAAISWAFMGPHSAFGHNLCDSMIQI